jgi:pantoate--beta-alanine ligase
MIRIFTTVGELRGFVTKAGREGKTVGLVPTMGALHAGHESLIRRSVAENDRTIVSIFVNPTQFGPGEDFGKYPRRLADDAKLCEEAKASAVFAPTPDEIYPAGFRTWVEVEGLTDRLCGASRPGHFRGVTTVCAKLFGMVGPDRAYFGEKDYQQLAVIRRMVADLDMNLEIVGCPTMRDADGLALSSRNKYLDAGKRKQALVLHRSLVEAKRLVEKTGVRRAIDVTRAMRKVIGAASAAKIDYIAVVHPDTLEPLDRIEGEAVAMLAVFINRVRLIDNMRIKAKGVK